MRKALFLSLLAAFMVSCATSKKEPVEMQPQSEKKVEEKVEKEVEQSETVEKSEEVKEVVPSVTVPESRLVLSKFKHSDHVKVIKEYGCIPCHHFNVEMHVPDVNRARQISEKFLKPSEASCKVCHTKGVE